MRVLTTFDDFKNTAKPIPSSILSFYKEIQILNEDNEPMGEFATDKLKNELGGNVYIIETAEDLTKEPWTLVTDWSNKKLDDPTFEGIFDVCEWLAGNAFVIVHKVTNNTGGAAFFVPRKFVGKALKKAVKATKTYWSENGNN
jgi:hypothetical protein